MLANIARISGRDVPQTASLPSIAACGSYAEAHQACKMILVAVFSNLVKKRHWRYSASTKDLEGYICGRPEEYEKGCVKVESRGLFQYSYHKTSVDGLSQLHQTAVQAATSDPSTYICGLHDAAEVPGDTLVVVTPTLHQPYDFLFGRSFKSLIGVDMIRSLALDFFLFCAFLGPLSAQNTYFTTPPPAGAELSFDSDPVYAVNSQVQLGWVTNVGSYSIWLWQQAGGQLDSATCGSQIYTKADGQTEAGETLWDVTTQNFLLSASNVFFLALGPYSNLTEAVTSHYFNITNVASSTSSTSALSTSTAAPTSSINSASSSTNTIAASSINSVSSGTATPAATSSANVAQVTGSSNETTVGLGVGLGVGIPIILLLSALLFLKTRKVKGANRIRHDLPAYREEHSQSSEPMVYNKRRPVELPVEMTPHLPR